MYSFILSNIIIPVIEIFRTNCSVSRRTSRKFNKDLWYTRYVKLFQVTNFYIYLYIYLLHAYYVVKNILYRNQFNVIQTEYFKKQFDKFVLSNSVSRNYKPRYWNFHTNDIFQSLDAFEDRLKCIKVC